MSAHPAPPRALRPGTPVERSPHPFRDEWLKSDHVQTAKEALKKLVADDPDSGPPLTLVRVTAAGIEWLDRGACEPDGSNALRDERQSSR
jgi:hypothetical protein